jgi:hypothetical protein
MLALHTHTGERVHVHVDDPAQLERMRPGSTVVVHGRWASGARAAGGRRRRFEASALAALAPSGGSASVAVAAASASGATAAGAAALASTPPAPADLSTIFIPSESSFSCEASHLPSPCVRLC